jgi:hypothetical protein
LAGAELRAADQRAEHHDVRTIPRAAVDKDAALAPLERISDDTPKLTGVRPELFRIDRNEVRLRAVLIGRVHRSPRVGDHFGATAIAVGRSRCVTDIDAVVLGH